MTDNSQPNTFWNRIRHKYRISVLHEETLTETWHVKLSWLGAFTVLTLLFLLTVFLLSITIIYTPIKHILPGYSENIRQHLIVETARIDSLETSLDLQRKYLDVVKQLVAGEVGKDTVISLDSLQLVMREELLEAKNLATQEFIEVYEQKEKDQLQLFDIQNTTPVYTMFRPVRGVIIDSYAPKLNKFGVLIQTPDNENVSATLTGTIVQVKLEIDNTYSMLIQHTQHLSIYQHIGKPMKTIGDVVQVGEVIGVVSNGMPLYFELWQDGRSVNPENVVAF